MGKFGEELGGWCSLVRREGHGVGLWNTIRGAWEAFKARTRFWHDVWWRDAPLKVVWNPGFTR